MLAAAVRAVSPVSDDDLAALAAAGRTRQLRRGDALTRVHTTAWTADRLDRALVWDQGAARRRDEVAGVPHH